jgi:hypothetical protein
VAETAGHRVHFERLGLQCVQCHSKGLHEFVRPTEACSGCHVGTVSAETGMAAFHCVTCHDFLATDHPLGDPRRADCLDCHGHMQVHGERFVPDAPMRFPCQQCHYPHDGRLPTVQDCLGCHHIRGFGLHGVPAHGDCMSCHQPHLWRVEERATCGRCHAAREEHYPDVACAGCHSFRSAEPQGAVRGRS